MAVELIDAIAPALEQADWARWGISVTHRGVSVVELDSELVLPSASMGKTFLLLAAAQALETGERLPTDALVRNPEDLVGDSGLWQYLPETSLTFETVCALVGALSDNTATNTLIRDLGIERVQELSSTLGMPESLLVDRIRDARTPDDPDVPSRARAADLAVLMDRIACGSALGAADSRVRSWLALDTDLSMVASAFDLDPLAHAGLDAGRWFFNKTGTDDGVRADAGSFGTGDDRWAYAVLAHWVDDGPERLGAVMSVMREIGEVMRRAASF